MFKVNSKDTRTTPAGKKKIMLMIGPKLMQVYPCYYPATASRRKQVFELKSLQCKCGDIHKKVRRNCVIDMFGEVQKILRNSIEVKVFESELMRAEVLCSYAIKEGNTLVKKRKIHPITYKSHQKQVDYGLVRRGLRKTEKSCLVNSFITQK